MSWLFLFTHLLAMLLVTGTPYYCYEDKCICNGNHADCSVHHHMDFIPRLPEGVTSVDISYNGVTRIDSAGFFVNVTHITSLVMRFNGLTYIAPGAFDILEKAHLAIAPGIDFGQQGEGFLRFSYANSMENIAEAMQRLRHYMADR